MVFVVNYPLGYFARRIGGDLIRVTFPVPEDQDPAYWEPSGDQIAEIQSADLVLLNGADYAKWTLRATLPWSRTVVTTEGMEESLIEIPDAVVHSHGPEGEHSHAGLVSETWLDPGLAIRQAHAVYDALCRLVPDQKTALEARFLGLQQDLHTLADKLDDVLQPKSLQPKSLQPKSLQPKSLEAKSLEQSSVRWLAAKPLVHYLLARYDATPEVLHWDALEPIDSEQWESLRTRLGGAPAVMLWTRSPLEATRDRLVAEGVQSIVIDTAAMPPKEGDFVSVMRSNIDRIHSALASYRGSVKPEN